MFNNDISYSDSDESLTSSYTNQTELSMECDVNRSRSSRKSVPLLSIGRRSKHIMLFSDDLSKRDRRREKSRILGKQLKDKRQLFTENLYQKIKELENEKSHLPNQSHKQDLKNEFNRSYSMNFMDDYLLTDLNNIPSYSNQSSYNFDLFNLSVTNVLKLNNQ